MFRFLSLVLFACAAFADGRPLPLEHQVKRIHDGIELYGIVHWGLNTYTDREWGFGDEDPALLAPTSFDAGQIVRSAKAGGLQGLILVAKHHDGFCLWPTKTTEHNITKSPFRGEKGDYVREMSDACRRNGLKFGVYCSPWDRNNPDYGTERYVETFRAQIRELLDGRYGDVFEMWFDNANGGDGYYGGARETRKIPPDYYRFDEIFRSVREMQPSVCIFNEDDAADFRWPGNEKGVLDDECRGTAAHFDISRYDDYMKWTSKGVMDGVRFHPPEADFPLRPGWFYHEGEKGRTKSDEHLMRRYLNIVGNGGSMNVGLAPDKRGVLCDEDVRALERFGELRRAFFSCPVTTGLCNVVVIREDVSNGERVDGWVLSAGEEALIKGVSIGIKRIRLLPRLVEAQNLRLQVSGRTGVTPVVRSLQCYRADRELLDRIFSSCAESGETDTAKWMNAGRGAKSETGKPAFGKPAGRTGAIGGLEGCDESKGGRIESPKFALDKGSDARAMWLVLNEDNDHFFKNPTELMTEEALKAYVDDFARGHVTHFFMCPVGQRASYDSKVWEPIWAGMDEPGRKDSAQKPDGTHDIWCVNCKKLHDAGIDPYAVWTKRCREKGVSPWVTMRMNDVHFCNITNYFRNTTFCRTRRDLWLNPETDFGEWAESQLNYAKKEVRDYNLAVVREMAERWDIDGLELDWMRFGYCLRPGHEAEDAHFVTEFVRDVRATLDEIGAKKGRRIALGTRVCYDPDISRELGMDVEAWARLGLLDVIVPHSFLSVDAAIPVAKWKSRIGAVAPGVKIVPGIDSARERFPWKKFPHDLEVMRPSDYRGVAEIFRRGGADGVYLFNLPYNGKWPTDGYRHGDMATEVYEKGLDPDETADLPRTYPPAYHDFPFAFRPAAPRQSDEIRAAIQPFVDRGEIAGIVSILSDDELNLTVDCFGWADAENRVPMTPDTVFAVFSMTKTVTGCALMCAIDRGLLAMDDPVEKYVPEFRDVSWLDVGARCIEVASGMKFEDFVRTNILNPLGMTSTGFNLTPDMERRLAKPCPAEGGLFSTPRDFTRFSQMLAHHGLYRGTWVVSRETFDRVWAVKQTAPGVKEPYSVGAWLYGDWMGHEGAMRTDQRANLRTGHSRLFFIQTENKAGKAFFDAKAAWHKAADAVQGTPATVFGN